LVVILIVISLGVFGVNDVFKNSIVERVFISKIFEYLVKKNKVNGFVVYFILKFEISFDFFFVRLNGVWFVFVSVEINYIMVNGYSGSRSYVFF